MKALFTLFVLSPIILYSQAQTAAQLSSKGLKKYVIESGEITYEIKGDATGEEKMVFTDFGWTSLRQQKMTFELYGITSTQSIYEIKDGDFVYRLNSSDSTYAEKKDYKWSQQASYKSPDQVSEAILFSMGGSQQADAVHLEKTCQVWTFDGKAIQEMWIWNGLVLKRKAKLGDRLIETAASQITLNISPNPIIFTLPEFYKKRTNN
ncbi:MAG: hypothetical protein HRT61_04690 [Ekhidna sp.]|nr:hypothetical protein [Ekhidna sp.]